ncbi:MAG: hypothetical protein WBP38_09680 [Hyphomicrobium sp.]|jgi:hypothetical protein
MKTIFLVALLALSGATATISAANAGNGSGSDYTIHGYEGLRYGN